MGGLNDAARLLQREAIKTTRRASINRGASKIERKVGTGFTITPIKSYKMLNNFHQPRLSIDRFVILKIKSLP